MTRRHLLLLAFALAAVLRLPAQTLASLRNSGPRENRVNLVFVAEGYTSAQATQFATDAAAKLQMLLENEAWMRFADQINADAIFVASAESGADDPSTSTVRNTYFNSTFGYQGVDRVIDIDVQGHTRLLELLTQFTPDYDVVILLVNSTKYGGSGGFPTISSLNASSDEIALHELGHSFAALTDEYVDAASAAYFPPAEYPNATQQSIPTHIPWRAFIQPTTTVPTASAPTEDIVGLFEGSHYRPTGFYRPTFNSKMLTLGRPFGPVNLRAFANAIHRLDLNYATAVPAITAQPVGGNVSTGQTVTLSVTAAGAGPLTYQWRFNSRYIANATGPTLTLVGIAAAQAGAYSVEITNAAGAVTSADAVVSIVSPPAPPSNLRIVPGSATLVPGSTYILTLTVTGTRPFTYQWRKDGIDLAGKTAGKLQLRNVTATDQGIYTVVASNTFGTSTSNGAVLVVSVPPRRPRQPRLRAN